MRELLHSENTVKKIFTPQPLPVPLLTAARELRKTMTDAEKLLWRCLRQKQLAGFRFRKQHPIEQYVLDFYCCSAKLAIELDGGQHNEPSTQNRDTARTLFLNEHGIQVIRFWNNDVLTNIEGVLESIYHELLQKNSPLPASPRWVEEQTIT